MTKTREVRYFLDVRNIGRGVQMATVRQYIANRLVEEGLLDREMQPFFELEAGEGDVMTILRLFKKLDFAEEDPERFGSENRDTLVQIYRDQIREHVTDILRP